MGGGPPLEGWAQQGQLGRGQQRGRRQEVRGYRQRRRLALLRARVGERSRCTWYRRVKKRQHYTETETETDGKKSWRG